MTKKLTSKKTEKKKNIASFLFLPERLPYNTYLWVVGIPALLGFVVFYPFLFGNDLYIFKDIGSDTMNLKYPNLVHFDRYLREEGFPMAWSFYIGMGQNMYSGWYFGIEGFFNWFFTLFTGSTAERIAWMAWAKTLTIAVFAYEWTRLRLHNQWISLIGALALAFSGYTIVGGSWYAHDKFVMNSLFVLLGLELLWSRKSYLLLPLAMYNFGVNPKLFFFFQFALLYFAIRGAELGWKPILWVKQGLMAVGLAALGFLGNSTGLISRVTTVTNSARMSTAASLSNDLSEQAVLSVHDRGHLLTTWMRTLSNDLLGSGSNFLGWNNYLEAPLFYCSILMIVLLPQLFLLGARKEKRLWGMVLGLVLIPLIFPYFRYAIYLFQGDYYKNALSLFVPLILVLTGTKSLELIMREKRVHLGGLLITSVLLLISLHYPYFGGRLELVKSVQGMSTFVVLLLTGILAGVQFHRLGRAVPYILLFVMLLDLGFNSAFSFSGRETMTRRELHQRIGYNDYTVEALDFIYQQDNGFFRLTKDYASANSIHRSLNEGRVFGFYGTTQYSSFNQANYIRFLTKMALIDSTEESQTRWAIGVEQNALLFPFAGVDYLLRKTEVKDPILANNYRMIGSVEDINIYKSSHRIPFGSFYSTAISENTLLELPPNQRALQLYEHIVLDRDDFEGPEAEIGQIELKNLTIIQLQEILQKKSEAGSFDMTSFSQNRIEGILTTDRTGWLFFTIPFDDGWQARINGKRVAPVRGQFGFTAVPVTPVVNARVELYFVPQGASQGAYASLSALFIWLAIGFFDFRRISRNIVSDRFGKASETDG